MINSQYYLLIHTDHYTGNFIKELIAYCFGKLCDEHSSQMDSFIKAFWCSYAGSGCNSLNDYIQLENEYEKNNNDILNINVFTNTIDGPINNKYIKKKIEEKKEKLKMQHYETDILRLYDTYLCNTIQDVDDHKIETFYNIESYYKNDKYNCDSIYIQLYEPLPEHLETIVITRIKEFFENDIYNIITDYEWVCHFGHKQIQNDKLNLLHLELIDNEFHIIKDYMEENNITKEVNNDKTRTVNNN